MIIENLNKMLEILKAENDWNDDELAAQVGVKTPTLRKMKKTGIVTKAGDVANIAELLGKTPNELMGWEEAAESVDEKSEIA